MTAHPTFRRLTDATGLDVIDPIETRHFPLHTSREVSPADADTDRFAFPVATACRIRTARLSFPYMVPMDVRTPDGDHLAAIDQPTTRELSADEYLLELHSPIKLYLRATAPVTVDATEDDVTISFGDETAVEVGARSYHSSPAATITVPDDPTALMEAVSAFPSALKTTSPERSWPTLRGHPPRIERGAELSIPDDLDAPETGVRIAVPPEYGYVYTVAPLAYYLGATVVPGDTPSLTADSGVARYLGGDVTAVGESVEELLKRVFLLDCVVRTEGLYPLDLHEREVLESHVDLDIADLYDAAPADRLAAYLDVPDEAVEAISLPWHRVTHVERDPGPDAAELLPYVVNDLSLVRVKGEPDDWEPTDAQQQTDEALQAFVRGPSVAEPTPESSDATPVGGEGDFRRSATGRSTRRSGGVSNPSDDQSGGRDDGGDDEDGSRGVPGAGGYIPLPETDALEQAWIGERTPVEGTKLVREAFEHDAAPAEDGTVEITAVCNDDEMREELDAAAEIYGDREDLRTEVTCEFDVSTDRLRELLAAGTDMFHFIGHIDGQGFQCADGVLDAATVEETNAKTVLLNGCRSHDQGLELVKAGASAAVVSLGDLWNEGAIEVGRTLARLFYHGFSIGQAMTLVREHTTIGREYVTLGDPGTMITQCDNGLPTIFGIIPNSSRDASSEEFDMKVWSYPVRSFGPGSTVGLHLSDNNRRHVGMGISIDERISSHELHQLFKNDTHPLIVDGKLTWTNMWLPR